MNHENRQEGSWLRRLVNHHLWPAFASDGGNSSSTSLSRVESPADLDGPAKSGRFMLRSGDTRKALALDHRFRADIAELLLGGTHRVRNSRTRRRTLRYTLFPFR
jgi:hypothetical protein